MLRDKALILLFLLVLAMLLVPFLQAQDEPGSHARMVRVTTLSGNVQIAHQQGAGYQNVTMNMPIVQGDVLRTGDDGWVEIQLENGSRIRLAPDTQLTFALMGRFASGSTETEVNLDDGEAAFAVVAGDDIGPFRINVRQRVISLKRSTRFRVTSTNSDPLEVVVWKGEVGIFDRESSQEVSVQTRETFALDPQDTGHYDLEKTAQVDELDDWANQRDQALMAYADTNSAAPALYYGSTSTPCASCQSLYNNYNPYWDQFAYGYGYGAYPPWGYFGGPGYPWGFGFFPFVPIVVVQPPVALPPLRPPRGIRPPRSAVTAAASSPAFTVSADNGDRTVISNEHPPVPSMVEAGSTEEAAASTTTSQRPLRVHPPVEMPLPAQHQAGTISTASSTPHPSPSSQSSQPHTFSAPSSFSARPASAGASAAHASSSGGGGHH
jgi:hypothetical protein